MKNAPIPQDDAQRLNELHRLKVLDTAMDEDLQNLVELASEYIGVPISLISLVDKKRQWFKARKGLEATETPRDISFCGHAIMKDKIFVVEDASTNPDFKNNPLVTENPSIRFYAGAPLKTSKGFNIGTLCLIDQKPRTLSPKEEKFLMKLAHQAVTLIELKFEQLKLKETQRLNTYFIHHLIHDVRNPLNSILMASEILKRKISEPKLLAWLEKSILSTRRVNNLASDLINLGDISSGGKIHLSFEEDDLLESLAGPLADLESLHPNRLDIDLEEGDYKGNFDSPAIYRACANLIINGIKLGSPNEIVMIRTSTTSDEIRIMIKTKGEMMSLDSAQDGSTSRDMRITIAHGIIKAHRGKLVIQDEGENSVYQITIPKRQSLDLKS